MDYISDPLQESKINFFTIKDAVLKLRTEMRQKGYVLDGAILFGSWAKGTAHKQSDIDLAILSRDFGKDRFEEGAMLNALLFKILPMSEAVPVSLVDYLDPMNISPILHEIKTTGKYII
jgi:uncharacterized protein